jgi:hypothetical protein
MSVIFTELQGSQQEPQEPEEPEKPEEPVAHSIVDDGVSTVTTLSEQSPNSVAWDIPLLATSEGAAFS